jgi:hypothetical protein
MSPMTQNRLTHLENIIAGNQNRFYEIGKALKEIRDFRLYKPTLFEPLKHMPGPAGILVEPKPIASLTPTVLLAIYLQLETFFRVMRPRFGLWDNWILLNSEKHGRNI